MNLLLEKFEELLPLLLMFGVLVLLLTYFQRKLGSFRTGRPIDRLHALPLRSPGESILLRIDRTTSELAVFGMAVVGVPLVLLLTYLSYLHYSGRTESLLDITYLLCLLVGFLLYAINKLRRLDLKKERLRRVYHGLQAVALEINPLMSSGYHVFHDFPSGRFHIDHIIVGPTGVFAIHSRIPSCFDPVDRRRSESIQAMGKELSTSSTADGVTIRTAVFHATWLANWLLTAVGEAVRVQPLLTLPGFSIENIDATDVIMADPHRISAIVRTTRVNPLSSETIQRLAAEIAAKYRREGAEKSRPT